MKGNEIHDSHDIHDRHGIHDVAVVGAGSAGLQAAQTLGRMGQRTVVLDTGAHRNDPAAAMHNFLGHDNTPPGELRRAARADAEAYDGVTFVEAEVVGITGSLGDFRLDLAGDTAVHARRVLLAVGVRDTLPEVPGVADLFGDLVAHCPFCHGHEFAGRRVGILGSAAHVAAMAAMLAPITDDVVVLAHGAELDAAAATGLERLGVPVVAPRVLAVRRSGEGPLGGLAADLADGAEVLLGGLFVKTDWTPSAPFAADLGARHGDSGAVEVDAFGRTSVPGLYAAGDLAQGPGLPMPMASVLSAAAGGLLAAAACVQDAALARLG